MTGSLGPSNTTEGIPTNEAPRADSPPTPTSSLAPQSPSSDAGFLIPPSVASDGGEQPSTPAYAPKAAPSPLIEEIPVEDCTQIEYSFGDQAHSRFLRARVASSVQIGDLITALIPHLRLPRVDARGIAIRYLLIYQGRYLNMTDTLASAGVQPGDDLDVIREVCDGG